MESKVELEKFNEVYLRVKCEPSIGKELSEFFTFEVPNAKFMPSVRNRVWDGRIRLFSPATGKIFLGLLPYVRKFLQKQGHLPIKYTGDFRRRLIDKELVKKFVDKISTIKIRDYQLDAIHHILNNDRGLILSPTGSGKSFIIYVLIRYYVDFLQEQKVLVVVPTTSLVEQMYSDFAEYGWISEDYCHRLYAGREKSTDKKVVISTWQSIYKMPKSYFSQFGAVFIDECHLAKAKSLTGIMTKLQDCKYRIGTTGTLDGTEVHQLVLEGLFAKHEQVTTTTQLIKEKHLSNLHISCIVLGHVKENRVTRTYQEEMEYLSTHRLRNLFIAKLVNTLEGNTLVLAQYIEKQLVPLCLMVTEIVDRPVHLIYGATPTEDREKVRKLVEKSVDSSIILASYGTFSLGINIKRLHNIVFASPYKSQIKVLQSIGRGLRTAEDKKQLKVFDISDDLSYNSRENYTLKHLGYRVEIYNKEEFEYEILPVKLKG